MSDLTSRHGARQGGWEEGHVTQEVLQTGMCIWGIEIPTIIIFQIQRLLVSEQRNNKFNQRWSLKEKERAWVLRESLHQEGSTYPFSASTLSWKTCRQMMGLNLDSSRLIWCLWGPTVS